MNDEVIIKTIGLTKKFGDLIAVDKLDLMVHKSMIHGFVGPNGAGKTTTMKMLVGAMHPSKGKGYIKGQSLGSLKARRCLGYSPEFCYFYPNMKALDYLIYMARLSGIGYREGQKRANKLMGNLGLEAFKNKQVTKFSAGMKKKMGLAQAMIHNPEILLLDEPTANLDPTGRMGIINTLKELVSESKLTVFISSHVLSELELLVDYVTLINKGSIVLQGEINSIKSEFQKGKFILNTSNNNLIKNKLIKLDSVLSIENEKNNELSILTVKPEALKKDIVKLIEKENILLEYFSADKITLEGIYKSMIAHKERDK